MALASCRNKLNQSINQSIIHDNHTTASISQSVSFHESLILSPLVIKIRDESRFFQLISVHCYVRKCYYLIMENCAYLVATIFLVYIIDNTIFLVYIIDEFLKYGQIQTILVFSESLESRLNEGINVTVGRDIFNLPFSHSVCQSVQAV